LCRKFDERSPLRSLEASHGAGVSAGGIDMPAQAKDAVDAPLARD
jgi:hypothetical protein